jgi:segregation and condensation protein A
MSDTSEAMQSEESAQPLSDAPQLESEDTSTRDAQSTDELTVQENLPLAKVGGQPVTEIPQDLFIPPEALEVFLDAFEGPLDLLLYLIRKQNIDILDINISDITAQYMEYVELMKTTRFELAAEYLVMAAMLAEIKSRSLLPRHNEDEEEEDDPRAELIRRLQEYERFKQAAENIDELPRVGREIIVAQARDDEFDRVIQHPDVDLRELLLAMADVMRRAEMFEHHHISREVLSTRERMSHVLSKVKYGQTLRFEDLFDLEEGKMGVVVTFLAVMELVKESLLELVQTDAFEPIHVKARMEATEAASEIETEHQGSDDVE